MAAAPKEISTIPDEVDIIHLAGDTLTISITAPSAVVDGKQWDGQVRSARDASTVDATFTITPPAVADGPAFAVLSAADSRALGDLGTYVEVPTGLNGLRSLIRYIGVWDVQVSDAGGDPVTTLAHGLLTIEQDVTRTP
jgi:hypothetical protein